MVKTNKLKRSITSKMFLLFFSCVIILFSFMAITTSYSLNVLGTEETYYRLQNYINLTSFEWKQGVQINLTNSNMENFGVIQGYYDKNQITITYQSIESIELSETDIINLLKMVDEADGEYETELGETIYYSYDIDLDTGNFIIVLVDNTYNDYFIRRIFLSIILVVVIVLLLLAVIMTIWVYRLTKRLRKLQDHISNMNKEKYEVEYLDDGDDEIRELSESIEIMREEIKNSETTKREMLQNVSHDFKTPISVIKNYAEAIIDNVIDPKEAIVISKQTDILKDKVSQLLEYNKLEYLTKDRPFEDVEIDVLCKDIVQLHKVKTTIKFDLKLEPCVFQGYKENYITVIENIIDNALRYAKSVIYIETKENKLTIYNDGEPIEEKFLNSNFKPYEKGSKGEFGLGMSIVKKTLDFFDLTLKIFNEPQGGVSFVISKEK